MLEELLIVGEPGFSRMIWSGVAGGILQDERFQVLPAGVVEVAVEVWALVGEPQMARRAASAAAGWRANFGLGRAFHGPWVTILLNLPYNRRCPGRAPNCAWRLAGQNWIDGSDA